jgi:protein-S-isoprenylcysteine O-methyltransferase Ste14
MVAEIWHYAVVNLTLTIQFLLCPVVLLSLLAVTAPYGRHHQPGWGPNLPSRSAWFLMELPALLVIAWLVLDSPARAAAVAWVPLAFWLVHYSYRTLLFPALMRPSGKTFPVLLVLFAVGFNVLNGYNNANALIANAAAGKHLLTPHFLVGTLVFWIGFAIHSHSDHVIRTLRKPGETTHSIPEGGLFRHVSSPHYLGEILQWTGWAILTWSLAGLAFALFTFCNLAPRAISNHRWYRQRFADYPRRRKVLVPGIF